jgi:hypothetical protein
LVPWTQVKHFLMCHYTPSINVDYELRSLQSMHPFKLPALGTISLKPIHVWPCKDVLFWETTQIFFCLDRSCLKTSEKSCKKSAETAL